MNEKPNIQAPETIKTVEAIPPREEKNVSDDYDGAPLTALLAISEDGIIGDNGDLPWRLSSDLRRFKNRTMGGVLIMGRKTYESIGRPLPGRSSIVLTRDANWRCEGVTTASNPEQALQVAGKRATFVVGGAEIYRLMLPMCEMILLTRVMAKIQGDTRLELNLSDFSVVTRTFHPSGERDDYDTE
ncbi:MAG: dihydrofolate reductase, partial [Planctomycetota bacterium]|nr:dihydrofolate reductase [Planctomycetota bacterium]